MKVDEILKLFARVASGVRRYLLVAVGGAQTDDRTLTVDVNDADRTVSLSGDLTVPSSATVSGVNTGDTGGTVTAVSVATANGVSGTSSGGATPALTITLGAITPTSVTASGPGAFAVTDAATVTQTAVLTLDHESSATPGALFGADLQIKLKSSTTASQNAGLVRVLWADAAHSTRKSVLSLSAYDGATRREGVAVGANGSAATVGFLGAAAAAQQTGDAGSALVAFGLMSGTPTFAVANLSGLDADGTLAANSDAKVATQKATRTYVDNAVTGLFDFKGATDASGSPNYPAASKGDAYVVSVAGKVGGASGKGVDVGDVYVASADNAGGTEAGVGASWFVLEHNLTGALLSASNLSDVASAPTARTNLGVGTADSPQLAGVNVGHASDTTLTRSSAGVLAVEGNVVYAAGGADVPAADGGTGRSSHTAYAVLCGGTTTTAAQQSVASVGTVGQVLTSAGAGALPTFSDPVTKGTVSSFILDQDWATGASGVWGDVVGSSSQTVDVSLTAGTWLVHYGAEGTSGTSALGGRLYVRLNNVTDGAVVPSSAVMVTFNPVGVNQSGQGSNVILITVAATKTIRMQGMRSNIGTPTYTLSRLNASATSTDGIGAHVTAVRIY